MKYLHKSIFLLLFACFTLNSCSQSVSEAKVVPQAVKPTSSYTFDVNQRAGGTAFYAMNSSTGSLSYMLDFGENAGNWTNYGNSLREAGGNPLLFRALESERGVIIYAMDGATGQIYYMLDHGTTPGEWMKYGGMIRQNALNMLQFDIVDRGEGDTTFFAYDSFNHNTYYMHLNGENAGKWAKYGTPYQAE